MSLENFKKIFWMEWAHRQVGRTIGLLFVLPAAYFMARGYVDRRMALRLTGIGALLGTQVRAPPRSAGRPTWRDAADVLKGPVRVPLLLAGPDWLAHGQERPGLTHCRGARRAARQPLPPRGAPGDGFPDLHRYALERFDPYDNAAQCRGEQGAERGLGRGPLGKV